MAITKTRKSLAEVALQVTPFLKVSGVEAPAGEFSVVQYLPVGLGRLDGVNDEYFVIEGGRVVAFTARTDAKYVGRIDLANGGANQNVVYTANDIGRTDDVANPDTLVTAAATVSEARLANIPIGIAPYPYYQGNLDERLKNFELQPHVAVENQGYYEYPMQFAQQYSGSDTALVEGGLVRPGSLGQILRWVNGTHSVEQLIGRVWRIATIAASGGLDKVHTIRGLGLSGTDTNGIPAHLNVDLDSGGAALKFFRVVINAAP
jgi:hypothetical protein